MHTDPVVDEVRAARDALAKKFNYDLRAIFEDARTRQIASGRKTISLTPRPVCQQKLGAKTK